VHLLVNYVHFQMHGATIKITKIGIWVSVHIRYTWSRFGSDRPQIKGHFT